MKQKPLTLESIIANSIGQFVLMNPDLTDTIEAYNEWAQEIAIKRNYPTDLNTMLFELEQFDACMHRLSPELLSACLEIEREFGAIRA